MLRGIRRLPTPASVISVVALIVAVGGGTAALAISDNRKDKKIAKRVANKQIRKKAPHLSVKHAKTADYAAHATSADSAANAANAANATDATNATHATNADNATQLGGVAAAAYQQESALLFATVATSSSDATVVSSRSRGAIGAARKSDGFYEVQFNRDVSSCTWTATAGNTGAAASPWIATTRAPLSGGTDTVGVVVFDDTGVQVDPNDVFVAVLCP